MYYNGIPRKTLSTFLSLLNNQIFYKFYAIIIFLVVFQDLAYAQDAGQLTNSSPENLPRNSPTMEGIKTAGPVSLMSNKEFWLSIVILVFGMFIVIVEYFLLKDVVKEKTDDIAKIYTVTLIIIGTLVLISSGFTNQQIAPALGLFGTIAGYLLGRADSRRPPDESNPKK